MDPNEARDMCICRECPSYFDCGEPLAFCYYEEGVSACIKVRNGCVCGGCPVEQASRFTWHYYCIDGSAKAHAAS